MDDHADFQNRLDEAQYRVIAARVVALQPLVDEYRLLKQRLRHIDERLHRDSYTQTSVIAVLRLLRDHPGGLVRSVIVEETRLPENTVKDALSRLKKQGLVEAPRRGFWCAVSRVTSKDPPVAEEPTSSGNS